MLPVHEEASTSGLSIDYTGAGQGGVARYTAVMSVESGNEQHPSRAACLVEAAFPIVAQQAYIWLVPHTRPRWWDVAYGLTVAAIVVLYVGRRGWLSWRTFGLAWGDDHRRAAMPVAVFTAIAVGTALLWGWLTTGQPHGGLRQNWDVLRAVLAYPLWGFVQQGVMFGVAYPRLQIVAGAVAAPFWTALLFAAAHAPNPLLMIGGAVMAFVFAVIWERAPSLPAIAISHGVIGAVCDKALHVSMRVGAHYFGG